MTAFSSRNLRVVLSDSGRWCLYGSGHVTFRGRNSFEIVHGREMYHERRGSSSSGLSGGSTAASACPAAASTSSRAGVRRTLHVSVVVGVSIGESVSSLPDCLRCEVVLIEPDVCVGVTRSVVGSTSAPGTVMKRHGRIAPIPCCRAGPM